MFDKQLIEEFRNTVNGTDFTFFDIVISIIKINGTVFALPWIGLLLLLTI